MTVQATGNHNELSGVYWIGGSPGAGKSSVTRILAMRHNLCAYYFDWHEAAHMLARKDMPQRFPGLASFLRMSMDERWVLRTPVEMAENTIASWTERFSLVLADLEKIPHHRPILVEGPGLFPDCVSQVISSPHHAIWLVPTPEFVRWVRRGRMPDGMPDTSEPMVALENLVQRDVLLAEHVVDGANSHGFTVVRIDGSRPIPEISAQVEAHFGLEGVGTVGRVDADLSREEADRFVGQYARADHRGFRVDREGGHLYLALPSGNLRGLLRSLGGGAFRLEDGPYIGEHVVFRENGVGEIDAVELGPGVLLKQNSPSVFSFTVPASR